MLYAQKLLKIFKKYIKLLTNILCYTVYRDKERDTNGGN